MVFIPFRFSRFHPSRMFNNKCCLRFAMGSCESFVTKIRRDAWAAKSFTFWLSDTSQRNFHLRATEIVSRRRSNASNIDVKVTLTHAFQEHLPSELCEGEGGKNREPLGKVEHHRWKRFFDMRAREGKRILDVGFIHQWMTKQKSQLQVEALCQPSRKLRHDDEGSEKFMVIARCNCDKQGDRQTS